MKNINLEVKKIIVGILEKDVEISDNTTFYEIGLGSYQFIQLCVQVEEKLKIEIPDDKLDSSDFVRVSDFVNMIESLHK